MKSPGKKSLYDPKDGSSNRRRAQEGRFSDHPAYSAVKNLAGVSIALTRLKLHTKTKTARAILFALEKQMESAMGNLNSATAELAKQGDKLRFAEAISSFFHPNGPDRRVQLVCSEEIAYRTLNGVKPSQAELRKLVKEKYDLVLSDTDWKRLLERVGLDSLPTAREKAGGQFT